MPPGQRITTAKEVGGKCRYCRGTLPEGRDLTYCPHCGQDLTVYHCPACSTELEVGWKFCVTCGRTIAE
jgi:predicted amidophosphoribosyltransferase